MSHVLAAITDDLAARPVITTARRLGRWLRTPVRAINVREDGTETAAAIAETAALPLQVLDGDPVATIIEQFDGPDVVLGVLGARRAPGGRRPAGAFAMAIAKAAHVPLVVVPPDCDTSPADGTCVMLTPLDGSVAAATGARRLKDLFAGADLEVVALHVFDSTTLPRFWDQPQHAAQSWGREFAGRHLQEADTRVELRTGSPGARVIDVATAEHAGLIALSWSQDLSGYRAQTLREVLTRSRVPVLLFPASVPPARNEHLTSADECATGDHVP